MTVELKLSFITNDGTCGGHTIIHDFSINENAIEMHAAMFMSLSMRITSPEIGISLWGITSEQDKQKWKQIVPKVLTIAKTGPVTIITDSHGSDYVERNSPIVYRCPLPLEIKSGILCPHQTRNKVPSCIGDA